MFNCKILTAIVVLIPVWFCCSFAQSLNDSKIDSAYLNAKKGIYWSLSNLPERKNNIENDLIINDKKIASVKTDKQVNGFKIVSIGFFESYEVQIKLFKSNETLTKEGFIKSDSVQNAETGNNKSMRKKKK